MCDVFVKGCVVCGKDLPVHLGDYSTGRKEVVVFCSEHIPEKDVSIFTLTEDDIYEDLPYIQRVVLFHKGFVMGMRYLTENAIKNKGKNHPNIGADWVVEERL